MARERDDEPRDDRDSPSRKRRDDDAPAEQLGPLDKIFRDTNSVLLIVFGICCTWIAAILGLVGMLTAKDPVAKKNATLVLIVGAVAGVLWVVGSVIMNVVAAGAAAAR